MTRNECFNILDLPADASREEIIKAYRHLAQVWHPDRFPNNPELREKAHAKLAVINQARRTLIEDSAMRDPSEGSPNNEESDAGQNPSSDLSPLYRDAQVRYLGHDPRLKGLSQWPTLFGNNGVPSAVEISSTGLALVTYRSESPDDAMWYATSSLVAVQLERSCWICPDVGFEWPGDEISPTVVRLHYRDPEGILKQLVVVDIKFRNSYYAQLFLKRIHFTIPFTKWSPRQPAPTSNSQPASLTADTNAAFVVAIGLFVLLLVGIGAVAYNALEVSTASSEAIQDLAERVPSYAVSKGSFSAWTEPRDPVSGRQYTIVIQVRLPANIKKYRASDLTGTVTGSDLYKQVIKFKRTDDIPIKDGAALVKIPVPGAAKLVRDTISIESSLLGEKQSIQIEF